MEATQHRNRVRVRVRRRPGRKVLRGAAIVGVALAVVVAVLAMASVFTQGRGLAHVDGAEITQQDILAEARARRVAASVAQPALLNAVIARELLVQEARRRKLDRGRDYPSDRKRAVEAALAAAFLSTVPPPPPPSQAEIDAFIVKRPQAFADRRRFIVDALSFAAAADPVSGGLSWDDLERKLASANIPHRRDANIYTSNDAPSQLKEALPRTAVGGLISVTGGGQVDVYRVLANDPAPLEGPSAVVEARTQMQRAARDAQIARLLAALEQTHTVRKSHTS